MPISGLVRNVTVRFTADMGGFIRPIQAAGGAVTGMTRTISGTVGTMTGMGGRIQAVGQQMTDLQRRMQSVQGNSQAAQAQRRAMQQQLNDLREHRDALQEQHEAMQNVGQTATVMGAAMLAGFGMAVKAAADFEQAMSKVGAVSNATGDELAALRKEAIQTGKDTKFSATEAAEAESELVKAGISTKDVLGGALKGALALAAAGQMDLADSAIVSAQAMNIFSLEGKDVTHIADVLAAGANKSAADVKDLAWSLRMGGQVAAQTGLSMEDTVGVLAAFADNALIGSDAGTSLKTMLQHLANPSGVTAGVMQNLGIQVYDTSGKFIGMAALADLLRDKLGKLTQEQRDSAMAQIFGSDAVRGANVLYKIGAQGVKEYTAAVNDNGAAADVAAKMMDNLSGDLETLKGSLETALIEGGTGANKVLREMVQAVTWVVNAYGKLPSAVQSGIVIFIGVAGAAIMVTKGMMFMINTVKDARLALTALGLTSERTAAIMASFRGGLSNVASFMTGPWGLAIAASITALGFWYAAKQKAKQVTEEFTSAIEADSGAIGDNTRTAVANRLEKEGMLKLAQRLGIQLDTLTEAVMGNRDAQAQVNQVLGQYDQHSNDYIFGTSKMTDEQKQNAVAAEVLKNKLDDQSGSFRKATEAAKRKTEATGEDTKATQDNTQAVTQSTDAVDEHTSAEQQLIDVMRSSTTTAKDLADAFDAVAGANLKVDKAAIRSRQALKDAADASDHRAGLSDKEKESLIGLAEAHQFELEGMKEAGIYGDRLFKTQEKLAAAFIKSAMNMGASEDAARELAQRYGLLFSATSDTADVMGQMITKVQQAAGEQQRLNARTGGGTNAQDAYRESIRQSLPVLYAMAGGNQRAKAQVDALASSLGLVDRKMDISEDSFLAVARSMKIGEQEARKLWTALQKIKSKKVEIDVNAEGEWRVGGAPPSRRSSFAIGGRVLPIDASSSREYDSVPALLRVDEHVLTPEEVDAAGGHGAVYRMRRAMLRGELKGFAKGGQVGKGSLNVPGGYRAAYDPIDIGYRAMLTNMAKIMAAEIKKAMSGGAVVSAARSMIGYPYSWGGGGIGGPSYGIGRGAGTYGFDCSGLTQYAWWKGRGLDIGGVTYEQIANSKTIGYPRAGALGFPHAGHVVLATGAGTVVQAPYTGAKVYEGPISRSYQWRWPLAAGFAQGGAVLPEELGYGRRWLRTGRGQADLFGLAGDPGAVRRYYSGGWITGRPGKDNLLLRATAGEFMVNRTQARRYAPLVEALNSGSIGSALLVSRFGGGGGSGASGGSNVTIKLDNHGVLGSRAEVERWLVESLESLRRRNRLPSA